jgi:hypothetical protein
MKRCVEAHRLYDRISSATGTLFEDASQVDSRKPDSGIRKWLAYSPQSFLRVQERRQSLLNRLLIDLARELGMLNLAEGRGIADAQFNASGKWVAARDAFNLAAKAVSMWFPEDTELLSEIHVEIAIANTKIGGQELIETALNTLVARVAKVRKIYGECSRTWDIERNLNTARLQSHKRNDVEIATKHFAELHNKYRDRFGRGSTAARECEAQLKKGLRKLEDLPEGQIPQVGNASSLWSDYVWNFNLWLLALPVGITGVLYYTLM